MAAGRGRQGEDWLIDQNHFGTQTKAFSFASPFKNHWDAYAGETMGGQSCCPRAPLCMAVSPMSKNLGKHCWLARTGPWRSSGRCRGQGQVGVGVCHPGPPHFVWKRGTARGAFGSFGPKSDQGAKTFGPTFRANLSTAGGTQWCPVVQLGARECGADGLWVTFTGLPQAVVLGGWSQNPNEIEGPQIHF